MELNGFNSDNYRYFYLGKSKDWSSYTNFSYGELLESDIVKISKEDLLQRLFSHNYSRIKGNIYEHEVVEYPVDEPFDIFKYISMQKPIKFKWDGVFAFRYDVGEYAFINAWMNEKMSSNRRSRRDFYSSVYEENKRVLNLISEEEKIELNNEYFNSIVTLSKQIVSSNQQLQNFKPTVFKLKVNTSFELEYNKDEEWYLTDPAIFMVMFNQDFIRLLANSTEILGSEKERIFFEEYKDNINNKKRRYYKFKDNIKIDNIWTLMNTFSLEHFGVGFSQTILRANVWTIDTCKLNKNNFNPGGIVKYFYVDYCDDFCDRIAEREILKVANRVNYEEAKNIEDENINAENAKKQLDDETEYIKNHEKAYKKYCQNQGSIKYSGFIESEKKQHVKRLVKILNNRAKNIN